MGGRKESFIRNEINGKVLAKGIPDPTQAWPGRRVGQREDILDADGALGRIMRGYSEVAGVWAGRGCLPDTGLIAKHLIYGSAGAIKESNISPCQR